MTEPDHLALDTRRRRILFRATHRGTFENDLMIGGFARAHLASLTEADLDALEAVMQIPDTDLAGWLTSRVPIPPEEDTPMLRRMREFQMHKLHDRRDSQTP
jgi:antitoxin CptB